jgi:peptidoglycan/LPS O-acetylase OafA/YrhL
VTAISPRAGNSYDFIRFVAASMVLFSHHFPLAARPEPVLPIYGKTFGTLAVSIFFSLSGFLIYRSIDKNADWWRFVAARFLRIVPNLLLAVTLTSLITLLYFGNYSNLTGHTGYVTRNLLLPFFGPAYEIEGVFQGSAYQSLNGPLWSLRYEIQLYFILFLIVAFSGFLRGWILGVLLLVLSYAWMMDMHIRALGFDIFQYSQLAGFFLSGALLGYLWQHWQAYTVPLGFTGLILWLACESFIPFDGPLNAITLSAAIVGLGSSRAASGFSRGGDASYGMYIYAWPTQQFCILLIPGFWVSMTASFVVTVMTGYATWHLLEKKCLLHVDDFTHFLRRQYTLLTRRLTITD